MLKVKDLFKSFEILSLKEIFKAKGPIKMDVLKGVSFEINPGDRLGIEGNNGSGKSTLLKILAGILTPNSGVITANQKIITSLISSNERSFYWRLTAEQNLMFFSSLNGENKQISRLKIHSLGEALDTIKFLDTPFMLLSSGQRKRLMIQRALMKEPNLILCDEITANLDNESNENVTSLLKEYSISRGVSLMWVSHSKEEINAICNKKALLIDGKLNVQK